MKLHHFYIILLLGLNLTVAAQPYTYYRIDHYPPNPHKGMLILDENTGEGVYRVRFIYPPCDCYHIVEQQMDLDYRDDKLVLSGYNPVKVYPSQAKLAYNADNFYLYTDWKGDIHAYNIDDAGLESEAEVEVLHSDYEINRLREKLKWPAENHRPVVYGKTLHLILVMDLQDPGFENGPKVARERLIKEFQRVKDHTGMDLKIYDLNGRDFNREEVSSVIRGLHVNPDDAIVFYYLGHGFRFDDQTSKHPHMYLGELHYDHPEDVELSLEKVYKSLTNKDARLTLVFGEMCNKKVGLSQPIGNDHFSYGANTHSPAKKQNYIDLFVRTRGSALVSTCKPGEKSWVIKSGGAYFFDSFMDAFQEELADSNANWSDILSDALTRTVNLSRSITQRDGKVHVQTPQYDYNIDEY